MHKKKRKKVIPIGKLIDADDFISNLFEQAITEQDIKFAHKVKYAVDKQKEVVPFTKQEISTIDTWVSVYCEEYESMNYIESNAVARSINQKLKRWSK